MPSASVSGDLGADLARVAVTDPFIMLDIGVVHRPERQLSPAAAGLLKAIMDRWPQ
jgi:hypothetical protein